MLKSLFNLFKFGVNSEFLESFCKINLVRGTLKLTCKKKNAVTAKNNTANHYANTTPL